MAKSKMIKDLANGSIDLKTALKRTKVLLSDLDNKELINWINYELSGYPKTESLPEYRTTKGHLMGSYFKGSIVSHMTWTNVSLPLGNMPEDVKEHILTVNFYEGIEALMLLAETNVEDKSEIATIVPADMFPVIATYNDDPYMIITSARVQVSRHVIVNILSVIENKLLDILLLLEKEFGNLDEMDLDITHKTNEDLKTIAEQIIVIVYNDQSVSIGDENKIKDVTIN